MSSDLTILSVSNDDGLLVTREFLLQHWGYRVRSATTDQEALALLEPPVPFDLVLLCHSLPESRRISLVAGIKQRSPRLPIVMLQGGMTATGTAVDAAIDAACESHLPENILNTIQQLTAIQRADSGCTESAPADRNRQMPEPGGAVLQKAAAKRLAAGTSL